jgi:hypothetical protein
VLFPADTSSSSELEQQPIMQWLQQHSKEKGQQVLQTRAAVKSTSEAVVLFSFDQERFTAGLGRPLFDVLAAAAMQHSAAAEAAGQPGELALQLLRALGTAASASLAEAAAAAAEKRNAPDAVMSFAPAAAGSPQQHQLLLQQLLLFLHDPVQLFSAPASMLTSLDDGLQAVAAAAQPGMPVLYLQSAAKVTRTWMKVVTFDLPTCVCSYLTLCYCIVW